ncbi:MADS-box protein SVP-like [Benincasa hispida]|uniref:MADS-box protein SVP-like n=1 Tax=Benincasa hispida TaxID=102211 RepID=UPI00190226DC|nr:MADS-box protein SVP-like [Benincasa hispida]
MGRGTLNLKLIPNLKSRRTTFVKRKKSLMKKAYELSTLCDVQTCVFIASDCDPSTHFETWPPNHDQIHSMIRSYKSHSFPKLSRNSYNLHQFFSHRMNKIATETSKLRHNVDKFKDRHLDSLSEHQLEELLASLDSKIGVVDGMIQFMEADYDHLIEEVSGFSSIDTPSFLPSETKETPELDITEWLIGTNGLEYNVEEFMETDNGHLIEETSGILSIDTPSFSPFETEELDISELLIGPNGLEYNVEEFVEANNDHLIEEASRISGINTPSFSPFETEELGISELLIGTNGLEYNVEKLMEANNDHLIEEASAISSINTPSFSPFETEELDISELLIEPDGFEYNVEDFQSLLEDELVGTLV